MTAPRVVRASKYRHVFGTGSKRDQCFEGAQVSLDSNDWHLVKANTRFMSIHWDTAGGGAFLVHPLEEPGRFGSPSELPLYTGHTGPVLDTDWHPFNEQVVASAGEDGRILIWNVPEAGPRTGDAPAGELRGHERRIVDLAWHPAAEGVLASASHDLTVRLWDVVKGASRVTLEGHPDAVLDQNWSLAGDRLATTCRDKHVRLFDPRQSARAASAWAAHKGVKGVRVVWVGESPQLITTGFGRGSEREVALWDSRKISGEDGSALCLLSVDAASGPLLPYYDEDCGLLYVAGKGDGNIRYYELLPQEANPFFALSEYKSADPQRGLAMLPKRAVRSGENEIARFIKIYGSQPVLEPLSFKVPRREGTGTAREIYPDALCDQPAQGADDYFAGQTCKPKRTPLLEMCQQGRAEAAKPNVLVIADNNNNAVSPSREPEGEEALRDAWLSTRKENDQLKEELAQKNIRIRQLEAQLGARTSG